MLVLVVGANGQLGRSLISTAPVDVELVSHGIETLDITDGTAVLAAVRQIAPKFIFNATAYTAVDRAEKEENLAFAVNAVAVGHLATAARSVGAKLIHISTDFVFDGRAGMPYLPDAQTAPLNAYGRTKLAGELQAGEDALIVRTSWVYGPVGGNFVRTMLRLMAERSEVRVVADQVGTPTYALGLAEALWKLGLQGATGVHHYTDAGACTWYDFAVAIQEEGLAAGLLNAAVPVIPISTNEFPTPAMRPPYSVLNKSSAFALLGEPSPHWRVNLRKMIQEIKSHG